MREYDVPGQRRDNGAEVQIVYIEEEGKIPVKNGGGTILSGI